MAPEQRIKHQETLQQTESPLLCIFLFGPFRLEWHIPSADEGRAWDKRTSARSLLKLVLCAPDRQATRSQLTHLLWPDADAHHARESLRSAIKVLRQSLRLADGHTLLETEGEWLRLPAQSRLWVDADAVETLVGQARTTPDEAVAGALWTEAHALLVGEFLADEPASEWLTSPWIRQRRDALLAARRQVIHQYADGLLRRGQSMQADTLLQAHVSRFPTDQDALVRLVKVLIEQGRSEEARQCVTRCTRVLAKAGKQPSPQLHALLDQAPSVSLLPSVIQLPQMKLSVHAETISNSQGMFLLTPPGTPLFGEAFARTDRSETTDVDIATWFGARTNDLKALGAFWNVSDFTRQQQQASIHFEIEKWNTMTNPSNQAAREYVLTRRMALATLATIPTTLLTKLQSGPFTSLIAEEFLRQCTTSITACYHLLKRDGIATVEYTLPTYLPILISLAYYSSQYQQTAASLASQGCFLMGLIKLHRLQFDGWVANCMKSVELAKIANDSISLVTSLTHLGDAYFDSGQPERMLLTYQYAASFLEKEPKDLPSLLRSRIYMGLAEAHARLHSQQDAENHLHLANEAFSASHEEDLLVLSLDYNLSLKILLEGFVRFDLGQIEEQHSSQTHKPSQYTQASHALAQIERLPSSIFAADRIHAEIVNQRALVAIKTRDMEMFEKYLIEGMQRAKELGSEKRRWEALKNWKTARELWPNEKRVLELADVLL